MYILAWHCLIQMEQQLLNYSYVPAICEHEYFTPVPALAQSVGNPDQQLFPSLNPDVCHWACTGTLP